jgi:hypothetical protein
MTKLLTSTALTNIPNFHEIRDCFTLYKTYGKNVLKVTILDALKVI